MRYMKFFIEGMAIAGCAFLFSWFTGIQKFHSSSPRGIVELINQVKNNPEGMFFSWIVLGAIFGVFLYLFSRKSK